MARPATEWTYSIESLANLSEWPAERVRQDISRGDLDIKHLEGAALWLASNANPALRAEIARRLIPAILGTRRRTEDNAKLHTIATSLDLMHEIFKKDRAFRDSRAIKLTSKAKAKKRALRA